MSKLRIVTVIALVAMVFVALPGCGKKVTEDNLKKIEAGMTFDEVKGILGKPTDTEDLSTEVEGVATVTGKVCTWVSGDEKIIVTFDEDDKVVGVPVGEGLKGPEGP